MIQFCRFYTNIVSPVQYPPRLYNLDNNTSLTLPPQHREKCEKAATSYVLFALESNYQVTSSKPHY